MREYLSFFIIFAQTNEQIYDKNDSLHAINTCNSPIYDSKPLCTELQVCNSG